MLEPIFKYQLFPLLELPYISCLHSTSSPIEYENIPMQNKNAVNSLGKLDIQSPSQACLAAKMAVPRLMGYS